MTPTRIGIRQERKRLQGLLRSVEITKYDIAAKLAALQSECKHEGIQPHGDMLPHGLHFYYCEDCSKYILKGIL